MTFIFIVLFQKLEKAFVWFSSLLNGYSTYKGFESNTFELYYPINTILDIESQTCLSNVTSFFRLAPERKNNIVMVSQTTRPTLWYIVWVRGEHFWSFWQDLKFLLYKVKSSNKHSKIHGIGFIFIIFTFSKNS